AAVNRDAGAAEDRRDSSRCALHQTVEPRCGGGDLGQTEHRATPQTEGEPGDDPVPGYGIDANPGLGAKGRQEGELQDGVYVCSAGESERQQRRGDEGELGVGYAPGAPDGGEGSEHDGDRGGYDARR